MLFKIIKNTLYSIFSIFGALFLGVVSTVVSTYVSEGLRGRSLMDFIVGSMLHYWILYLFLLVAFLILRGMYILWAERKEESRKFLYKPTKEISPDDFDIANYKESYIPRVSDVIESDLQKGKYILITGRPGIGKTREAYEVIKRLEDFLVVKPKSQEEKIKIPHLRKKNFILFLDNLRCSTEKNVDDIDDIIDELKKKSKRLLVVATCHTGDDLDQVKDNEDFFRKFTPVELRDITKEEGENLAKDTGLQWKLGEFEGTPGSVILDFGTLGLKYDKAELAGKCILRAVKLLKEGNLPYEYEDAQILNVCRDIFELHADKLLRSSWEETIDKLKSAGFISKEKENENSIYVYDGYLEKSVHYKPSRADLLELKNMLVRQKDCNGLCYLGSSFSRKKDYLLAKDCYLEAVRMYPRYEVPHLNLSYVLTKLGEGEEAKGKYIEAENLYTEAEKQSRAAIETAPNYSNHNALGYILTKLGEVKGKSDEAISLYKTAVAEHKKALKLKPKYSLAHRSLAYALSKLGKAEEAEKEYREAIKINPESPFTHNLLAHLLVEKKRYSEAEDEYREAIRLKPDYASAHNNLGHLLAKTSRYSEAEKEYREAIRLKPDYPSAHRHFANILAKTGRYKEAESEYKETEKIASNYPKNNRDFGIFLSKIGRKEDAKKEFELALELFGKQGKEEDARGIRELLKNLSR